MKRSQGAALRIAVAVALAFCALPMGARAGHPAVERLNEYDAAALFEVMNGSIEKATIDGAPVLRWHVNAGQSSQLSMRRDHPLFDALRYYGVFDFEFRIAGGELSSIDFRALGHVTGIRSYKAHEWHVAVRTTQKGVWHRRQLTLTRPNWLPWDNPDGEGTGYFRFDGLGLLPGTVVELRNVRLVRPPVLLKPYYQYPITWPVLETNEAGDATYSITHRVLNAAGRPVTVEAKVLSANRRFHVTVRHAKEGAAPGAATAQVPLKNGRTADFTVQATMKAADIAATEELYTERLQLSFGAVDAPEAACHWEGAIVRPLSPGIKRQVIFPEAELQQIRDGVGAGDAQIRKLAGYDKVIGEADTFLAKKLLHIPSSNEHPGSFWVGSWRPGDFMTEAVDTKTGERQTGTQIASITWKKYFGYPGYACENLGKAYLYTGDEKYVKKGIEFFKLYARQYRELRWGPIFGGTPWDNDGPPLLCSSRVAVSSTYGTNMNFKWHCRLLSMIAESPSWTDEDMRDVYLNFVLPYATELMKFPGPISNMTDITNHNVLLLGIVFRDANLVRWATRTDPGIISRLRDIDNDGFSSEGRPLNYHFAAMAEFVPSIGYLARSGLPVQYPGEKLLAAVRMPYYRCSLTGYVPNSGDCGRGRSAGRIWLAESLIPIFPDEGWLYDAGASPLQLHLAGRKSGRDAWRKLIHTGPHLFREAGMAIVRSGDTAQEQVMATLDYGRNVFHAGLDRNQITLSAFGKVYTHGPGSLYNAGSGGIVRSNDARLNSFVSHGSLSHNVIMVDAQNQLPAVGRLLAWSDAPAMQVAVSRVGGVRPGVGHTRGLVLTDGVLVLLDRVESQEEHTYDFVYHNFGTLAPGEGWTAQPEQKPLATTANYGSIVDLKRLAGAGPIRLEWDLSWQIRPGPQAKLRDAGDQPPPVKLALWQLPVKGGRVYTGSTALNNPNTGNTPEGTPTIFHRVRAKTAHFVTVLEPFKEAPRVTGVEAAGADGITVVFGDGRRVTVRLGELVREHGVAD